MSGFPLDEFRYDSVCRANEQRAAANPWSLLVAEFLKLVAEVLPQCGPLRVFYPWFTPARLIFKLDHAVHIHSQQRRVRENGIQALGGRRFEILYAHRRERPVLR